MEPTEQKVTIELPPSEWNKINGALCDGPARLSLIFKAFDGCSGKVEGEELYGVDSILQSVYHALTDARRAFIQSAPDTPGLIERTMTNDARGRVDPHPGLYYRLVSARAIFDLTI